MALFRRVSDGLPPLVGVPKIADLPPAKLNAPARYLGTVDTDGNRVIGQSLAAKSSARLSLSSEALDVVRMAGSFRIPADALRGASGADLFLGKPVADLLVVRWVHGGEDWRTGFRLEAGKNLKDGRRPPNLGDWVRSISKIARANDRGNA